jgi:pyruvate kinase
MLSAETSIGDYPVQSVEMMTRIIREAEKVIPYEKLLNEKNSWQESDTDELISYNASYTACALGAAAIVAFTQSGVTAGRISKYRPGVPIVALTPHKEIARRLALMWGVFSLYTNDPASVDEYLTLGEQVVREHGFAKKDDQIVITAGIPTGHSGTNLLKVQKLE